MAAIPGSHALLTNIVLAWNTSGMGGVVARLKRDGDGIKEDGLRQMGPAHFLQAGMSACRHVGMSAMRWSADLPLGPLTGSSKR